MLAPLLFRLERRTRKGRRQFVGYGTVPGLGRVRLFQTSGPGIERALGLVQDLLPDLALPPGWPPGLPTGPGDDRPAGKAAGGRGGKRSGTHG
jgi:hypothetical protein